MRANIVEAEAEVPLAMAEALQKGTLGAIDYYKLKNIHADTEMRTSLSSSTEKTSEE